MSKKLIAYYSRADENYVSGQLKYLKKGNTEIIAEKIVEILGKNNADLFKIEQQTEYSKDYNECIEQARNDQRNGVLPELKVYPESLDGYDEIYLCYPNYWGTAPMAVFGFLKHFDLSGKTIKPLCTHEGSGLGRSESDVKNACGATVKKGLAVRGSNCQAGGYETELKKWVLSD